MRADASRAALTHAGQGRGPAGASIGTILAEGPRQLMSSQPSSFRHSVAGVELHWSERGAGSTVVVLHGLADSERTWWPVMAQLGRRHRVLGLDLPGCGLSARPDASYRLDWQARLVAAWLDHIGVTTCDVVAHSYGGGLALWLLLYRPDAIRRLALIAPGGLGKDVAIELRLAALPFVVEHAGQPWMRAVTWLQTFLNGRSLPADQRRLLSRMNAAPGSARAFARTVRDVIDWRGQTRNVLDRAREIRALPAIALFWGENDRIIPIRQGEALCSMLENCTLERFPGAGHFLHWERPQALAASLLRYLEAPNVPRARLRPGVPVPRAPRLGGKQPASRPSFHIGSSSIAIMKLRQEVMDSSLQLLSGALNGLVQGCGLVRDRDGLVMLEASFHHAALVVCAPLLGVLIAEVDLHTGDPLAGIAETILDHPLHVRGEPLVPLDIVVGIDLNVHNRFLPFVAIRPMGLPRFHCKTRASTS